MVSNHALSAIITSTARCLFNEGRRVNVFFRCYGIYPPPPSPRQYICDLQCSAIARAHVTTFPILQSPSRPCRSLQALHMASNSSLPELATVQPLPDAHSSLQPQLELMHQMLREQQQTIAALQQEVKQLKVQPTASTTTTGSYRGRLALTPLPCLEAMVLDVRWLKA